NSLMSGKEVPEEGTDPKRRYHCISVSDNGIGFDPQYRKRIFELFQRVHEESKFKGTGIGLSIVKKIVDNHNGIVTADSTEGLGTTFTIYLPAENL
ncbi:MAG TPA: ATP-binding protein, partial [Flavobacterium sp.]|nr:ATP-binding protein [Flavobacterium sp.]